MIGKDGSARSVAGPGTDRIKGDIRNIIQLVVVNDSGKIVAFDEVRRAGELETEAVLSINSIPFGQTYHFLLLMGHWERDYDAESGGNYVYTSSPPTLLAAGLKNYLVTGSGKITITMWPVVVDTKFTTSNTGVPAGSGTAEPVIADGKPEKVSLLPVDWGVTWTVKRGASGNGFADLVKAQKVVNGGAGDELLVKSKQTVVRGTGLGESAPSETNTTTGNVISSGSIGTYTSGITRIGTEGSANFKLEYVPFNLTGAAAWNMIGEGESAFNLSNGGPVWIIRNGVNDLAQDGNTDFNTLGKTGNASANGNGAVAFKIEADGPGPYEPYDPEDPPPEGSLVIKDGVFDGPADSTAPQITFTTEGYSGEADAYYAVVDGGGPAPGYSEYTHELGSFAEGENHHGTVALEAANGDYDIYVVVFKDGQVSAPIKINTMSGGGSVDWEWGEPGRFMTISVAGEIAVSDDAGRTWRKTADLDAGQVEYWYDVAYGNGVFIMSPSLISVDGGNSWTQTSETFYTGSHGSIIYENGRFLAFNGENSSVKWSDDDGLTWHTTSIPVANWLGREGAYGEGILAAVGGESKAVAWSEDGGETWQEGTIGDNDYYWWCTAYGNGVFAALSYNAQKAAWSEDGKTWTVTDLSGTGGWWGSVIYADDVFVAVGGDYPYKKALWSEDGKTWTSIDMPAGTGGWWGLTYGKIP
jgi:hypothetical protein